MKKDYLFGSPKNLNVIRLMLIFLFGAALLLSVSACGEESTPGAGGTPTVPGESTPATLIPTLTETVTPTETSLPERVILYLPAGTDPQAAVDLETLLRELSESDGLQMQVTDELSLEELGENVRLVVVTAPDPGVTALAAAAPDTEFLAIGIPGIEAGRNLSTVGAHGERPDQQGFLAGYLAAVITPGWRVGNISTSESIDGNAASKAFSNGVAFFCGLCRPSTPPFVEYPQFYNLASGDNPSENSAAAAQMANNAVQTVYVVPSVTTTTLLETLADAGMILIGSGTPSPSVKDQWAASIDSDWETPIRGIWPEVIAGMGGISRDVPLVIHNQNPLIFSPGRQRLVEETLADLLADFIDTGVDPITGEGH